MKILIIANGDIKDVDFHKDLANKSDIVICADGGVKHCLGLNIVPDYVIGDFDSVDQVLLEELKANNKTKVMYDPDQDKTDLELAITLSHSLDAKEINIIGAIGDRMDHTLGNILCLNQIDKNIKAKIINEKNIIELVSDLHELEGEKGDIVSVIPLNLVIGLTYEGLKWEVKDKQVDVGWLGICNKMEGGSGLIKLENGKILVIRVKN